MTASALSTMSEDATAALSAASGRYVRAASALEFTEVTRRFPNGRGVGPVSLSVPWGTVCSLIGSNGSGKTTLLRCAGRFELPDSGEIKLDGRAWAAPSVKGDDAFANPDSVRGTVLGIVAQNAEMWTTMRVIDNVMMPLLRAARLSKKEALERAEAELERFGLTDRAKAMPHQLSGGIRQRVTLARALALRPRILLLDEATSALDPDWTERVRLIIRGFADSGGAVVSVSHRIGLVRRMSDHVVYLSDGKVVEEGRPESVLDSPRDDGLRRFLENS